MLTETDANSHQLEFPVLPQNCKLPNITGLRMLQMSTFSLQMLDVC